MRKPSVVFFLNALIAVAWAGIASADPWIAGVTPRVIGCGTTSEIIVAPWRHEAIDIIFYPLATVGPETTHHDPPGVRCVGTQFDFDKHRLVCQLEVAADCPPGEYPFRVLTAVGLSSLGTIYVSPFPVHDENESQVNSNDRPEDAVAVELNTTVRGTLSNSPADDIDCYRVAGRAGERLSVEVDMVKLGDDLQWNPVPDGYDSVISILDPTGKRLASNDDSALNRQDPLVSVELPSDGDYTIVLRRSMFVPLNRDYALHVGQFLRPLAAFPPGGQAGSPVEIKLLGDPLGSFTQTVDTPTTTGTMPLFGEGSLPLLFRSSPFPNLLEAETAEQTETTVPAIPIAINGILAQADETDRYRITVQKDQPLQVRVWASGLGSPVDPSIRISPINKAGEVGNPEIAADDATLQERDIFGGHGDFPELFDPSLIWNPKQDGEYLLEIADPRGVGGPTHVYRIEIAPPENKLHIGLSWEDYKPERPRKTSLSIPQGGQWTVRLSLYPSQGSNISGSIDLGVEGLPPGITAISPQMPELQSVWPMTFIADKDATLDTALIRITAKPADGGEPFTTVNQQNLQRVSYSHYPWRNIRVDQFAAAVSEPAGFEIHLEAPKQPLMRGSEMTMPLRIVRHPGFEEPLEIQCELAPAGVGTSPAETIPPEQETATLTLSAEATAKLGSSPLYVLATTTKPRGGRSDSYVSGDTAQGSERIRVSSDVVAIEVAEPFVAFASEPQSVRRGDSILYRWTVQQLRPFEGEAKVRMIGLPVGLIQVGEEPTIRATTSEVFVELAASDEALTGLVNDLKCDVLFSVGDEEIRLRTGSGKLRIDPRLEN